MTDIVIDLRASEIHAWIDCSRRAMYVKVNRKQGGGGSPVALAVGNAVHHNVTGHEYESPSRVSFDKHTRSTNEMNRQIDAMSKSVKKAMNDLHLNIIDKERYFETDVIIGKVEAKIHGTIDLLCEQEDGQKVILDLKTGFMQPKNSWVQLAIYAWLCQKTDLSTNQCMILWVKRSLGKDAAEIKRWQRSVNSLIPLAELYIKRVCLNFMSEPIPNPSSMSCYNCPVSDCDARLVD